MGKQLFLDHTKITIKEDDIQGDVLIGLQKKAEIFAFFKVIENEESKFKFKDGLKRLTIDIETTKQTRVYEETHVGKVIKINIAFSASGLGLLGAAPIGADASFVSGMKEKALSLGDDLADWLPPFRDMVFDGLLLIAAWDPVASTALTHAKQKLASIVNSFGGALVVHHIEEGILNAKAPGHEVFGFADGVSQPAVEGLHRPEAAEDQSFAGQDIVKLGDFVLGPYDKENGAKATPPAPWMENGSYLVFRRLRQDVAAFEDFTQNNFKTLSDSADHFAASLIGRWKDGSPLARDPVAPNPHHDEKHPRENNDFEFGIPSVGQSRCPFNGHIRRVYPRSDIQQGPGHAETRRILRSGIAFDQTKDGTADQGLLFVCYQSSIVEKFDFIQTLWANATGIPFDPPYPTGLTQNMPTDPGIDLIIGQGSKPRDADWTLNSKTGPFRRLTNVPKFVTATGGGYFFAPSISGLRFLAEQAHPQMA